jgi:hypothetical protein
MLHAMMLDTSRLATKAVPSVVEENALELIKAGDVAPFPPH